jgi:hypothetical protein
MSIDGQRVRGMAPEELLIVLCVHGSKHAWERLKWVADVAELLRAHRLDWQRVFSTATKWKCRRMLLLGLALADRLMKIPLPPDILSAISADHDVPVLARCMPKSVLADQDCAIDEQDAVALYFSLKDNWWERWRYWLVHLHIPYFVVCLPGSVGKRNSLCSLTSCSRFAHSQFCVFRSRGCAAPLLVSSEPAR